MKAGDKHQEKIAITPQLVEAFAQVSGDFNPIHLDPAFARQTPFGRPIAHGLLSGALLSGVMGTKFPGPGTILIEISTKFLKPVFVGDNLTIEIETESVREDKPIATLLCRTFNGAGELASEGRTVVKLAR